MNASLSLPISKYCKIWKRRDLESRIGSWMQFAFQIWVEEAWNCHHLTVLWVMMVWRPCHLPLLPVQSGAVCSHHCDCILHNPFYCYTGEILTLHFAFATCFLLLARRACRAQDESWVCSAVFATAEKASDSISGSMDLQLPLSR